MSTSNLRPVPPRAVQIPPQLETLGPLQLDEIGHRSELEYVLLRDVDLRHRDLGGSSWTGVVAERSSMANADLSAGFVTDTRLVDADLANLNGRNASLLRVEISGGRAVGMSLPEATLQDTVFADTQLDLSAMRFARLQRVVFRGCRMHEVDLSGASLQSVLFEDCDLSGADLRNASFERCELRSCVLDGMRGVHDMSGIAMSLLDVIELAPLLAAACGIRVLVDDAED